MSQKPTPVAFRQSKPEAETDTKPEPDKSHQHGARRKPLAMVEEFGEQRSQTLKVISKGVLGTSSTITNPDCSEMQTPGLTPFRSSRLRA